MADVRWQRLATAIAVSRLAVLFVLLGGAKRILPVQTLAAWAARPGRRRRMATELIVGRVLRAGVVVGTPDRDCLQRSLLLYRELCRAGTPAALVVGVRHDHGRLCGHAWVRVNGDVIIESADDVRDFVPVLTFESGEAPVAHAPARLHA